tara:strand:+ start:1109 stop:2740 length:1632 start_codon:yes stop_codon:yes gene_type:complete
MDTKILKPKEPAYQYPLLIKRILEPVLRYEPNQLLYYDQKCERTYSEFYDRVCQLANVLKEMGVKPGDTVAFMDWDSLRYLEAFFAVPMIGAILHTVNPRLSPKQILYTINHAEDHYLFVHHDFLPLYESIRTEIEDLRNTVLIIDEPLKNECKLEFHGEYEALINSAPKTYHFEDFDENSIATTFYTTGTTGEPKGVLFTHRQLVLHTLIASTTVSSFASTRIFDSSDVYMPLTPMFHVHAWGIPYGATMFGAKQVYPGRYEPLKLLKLIEKHKVSFSHCVPAILNMILDHPESQNVNLRGWKVIIGGSALSPGLAKKALSRGIEVYTGYGMSETCPLLTLTYNQQSHLSQSLEDNISHRIKAGMPVPLVDLKIQSDDGSFNASGEPGEIVVRAPWLTSCYAKDEEATSKLWSDGWLHTGDVGYIDESNYLIISDRIKDVIKSGGEWVSSIDLERLITLCDGVQEVAVVGIDDEKWGERPVAWIKASDLTARVIKEHLDLYVKDGVIPAWAIPEKMEFVEEIPKTSVGKVDKKEIRQRICSV